MNHPRADLMVERLARALEETPFPPDARTDLVDLARRVMTSRCERYADEHHPALLHPLRALLLVLETEAPDARACAVALSCDTSGARVVGGPAADVAEAVAPIVDADPEDRLERLVTAPAWVLSGWLAARLDHVRHLHMWAGPQLTAAEIESAAAVEDPLATRAGGRLQRAWTDWLGKARRYPLAAGAKSWSPDEVRPR